MKIACPGCKAIYSIDDSRIPPGGLNMKCPRCEAIFAVRLPQGGAQTAPTPLPGPGPRPGREREAGPIGSVAPPAGPPPGAMGTMGNLSPPAGPPPGMMGTMGNLAPPAGPPPGMMGNLAPPAGPPPGVMGTMGNLAPPAGPPPGAMGNLPPPPGQHQGASPPVPLPGQVSAVPLPGTTPPPLAGGIPSMATQGSLRGPGLASFDPFGAVGDTPAPPLAAESGAGLASFDPFAAVGGTPSLAQSGGPSDDPFAFVDQSGPESPGAGSQAFFPPPPPEIALPGPGSQGPGSSATISLRQDPAGAVPLPGVPLPELGFEDSAPAFDPIPAPPPDLGFDFGAVDFDAPPPPPPSGGLFPDDGSFDLPQLPSLDDSGLEFDPSATGPAPSRSFFPDVPSATNSIQASFHVRSRSGERLGSFPAQTIRAMIGSGQMAEDVEVSRDGSRWMPPSQAQGFGAPPMGRPGIAPPVVAAKTDASEGHRQQKDTALVPGRIPGPSTREQWVERLQGLREGLGPRQLGLAAAAAFLVTGGLLEVATPWGFWFHRAVFDSKAGEPPAARVAAVPVAAAVEAPGEDRRAALLTAIGVAEEALASREPARAAEVLEPFLATAAGKGGDAITWARAWSLSGAAKVRLGKREEAEEAFTSALKLSVADKATSLLYSSLLLDSHRGAEAVETLEQAWNKEKGDIDLAVALGRALVSAGRMLQADELVSSLVKTHPDEPKVSLLRGLVADQAEKPDDAIAFFLKALEAGPAGAGLNPIRLALADTLSRRGDLKGAGAYVEAALGDAPGDPQVLIAQARLRLLKKDPAGARASFEAAIEAEPGFIVAHLGRAELLEQSREFGAAKEAWEKALAIDPRRIDAWLRYGTVLGQLGEGEGAIAALEKARALEPANAGVLSRLGAVQHEAGKIDDAILSIEAALSKDNTLPEPWLILSRLRVEKGDLSGAVQAARRAVSLDEKSAAAAFQLGLAYQQGNNPAVALEAFDSAVALQPDHADALEHRGQIYMALNALDRAVQSFEAALAKDPARTRLLLTIGDCHLRSNRWDQAIAVLRRAERDKGLQGVSLRLGLAYQEKGGTVDAINWFQKAAEEDPSDAKPWRQLGYAYKERNRIGEAVTAFRRYLERSPGADDRLEIEDEIATLR